MPRRQFVPDEKRSLRGIFFISSMVLVGTTVWALWDESVSRRPWIRYQTAFKQVEYQMVEQELEEARARLDQPEVQTRLEKLREEQCTRCRGGSLCPTKSARSGASSSSPA